MYELNLEICLIGGLILIEDIIEKFRFERCKENSGKILNLNSESLVTC